MTEIYSKIPMTPDRTVEWDVIDRPETGGFILMPPDGDQRIINILTRVATARVIDPGAHIAKILGEGSGGIVYAWPDPPMALKAMHTRGAADDFPALQRNVTLSVGLQRIKHPKGVTLTTPQYHGAFFPYQHGAGMSLWAMSQEKGATWPHLPKEMRQRLPSLQQRQALYSEAMQACMGSADLYGLDMAASNELVRPTATTPGQAAAVGETALTVVKLDVAGIEIPMRQDTSLYDNYPTPRPQ
jgi:hypothetical protein